MTPLLERPRTTDPLEEQFALPWGIRSRYYDPSTTAELFYEAEKLTPLPNGAVAVTGVSGASGGSMVTITGVAAATWTSMLVTTIAATTGNLTHQGSYRVWARCYSSTGTPSFQLLWGVGSLSVPVTNTSVTLPATSYSGFYLLDLGEVRIDGPPVGTAQWLGAIQVYSATGGASASIDCIYLQPLDDGAGQLTYVYEPPASSLSTTLSPTTGTSVTGVGTIAWTNPSQVTVVGEYAYAENLTPSTTAVTNYLVATGFGFSVPSGATIQGIQASITREGNDSLSVFTDARVRLVGAGTVESVWRPCVWGLVAPHLDGATVWRPDRPMVRHLDIQRHQQLPFRAGNRCKYPERVRRLKCLHQIPDHDDGLLHARLGLHRFAGRSDLRQPERSSTTRRDVARGTERNGLWSGVAGRR